MKTEYIIGCLPISILLGMFLTIYLWFLGELMVDAIRAYLIGRKQKKDRKIYPVDKWD